MRLGASLAGFVLPADQAAKRQPFELWYGFEYPKAGILFCSRIETLEVLRARKKELQPKRSAEAPAGKDTTVRSEVSNTYQNFLQTYENIIRSGK